MLFYLCSPDYQNGILNIATCFNNSCYLINTFLYLVLYKVHYYAFSHLILKVRYYYYLLFTDKDIKV